MLIPPSFFVKSFLYCSKILTSVSCSRSLSTSVILASQLFCFGFRKTRLRLPLPLPRTIELLFISVTRSFAGTFLPTSRSEVVLITETLSPFLEDLSPVDLCRDRLLPVFPLPRSHPHKVDQAWVDWNWVWHWHWGDIFSRICPC